MDSTSGGQNADGNFNLRSNPMSFKRGYGEHSIARNIKAEEKAGRSEKQAVAIALNVAYKAAPANQKYRFVEKRK